MADYLVLTLGCFFGGVTLVYGFWFLINTQRRSEHTNIYNSRIAVCLAIASVLLSGAFLYGLMNNPIHQTIQYWMRMTTVLLGLTFLTLTMYYYENESMRQWDA